MGQINSIILGLLELDKTKLKISSKKHITKFLRTLSKWLATNLVFHRSRNRGFERNTHHLFWLYSSSYYKLISVENIMGYFRLSFLIATCVVFVEFIWIWMQVNWFFIKERMERILKFFLRFRQIWECQKHLLNFSI